MPEVQSLVARRAATARPGGFVLALVLVAISLVVPVFPHPEWALSLVAPRAPTARPGGLALALVLVAISLVVPNLPHPEWALPISHVPPIPKQDYHHCYVPSIADWTACSVADAMRVRDCVPVSDPMAAPNYDCRRSDARPAP